MFSIRLGWLWERMGGLIWIHRNKHKIYAQVKKGKNICHQKNNKKKRFSFLIWNQTSISFKYWEIYSLTCLLSKIINLTLLSMFESRDSICFWEKNGFQTITFFYLMEKIFLKSKTGLNYCYELILRFFLAEFPILSNFFLLLVSVVLFKNNNNK